MSKAIAQKIHDGAQKQVCATVKIVEYQLHEYDVKPVKGKELSFNPRKSPSWQINGEDIEISVVVPGSKIVTQGRKIILLEET